MPTVTLSTTRGDYTAEYTLTYAGELQDPALFIGRVYNNDREQIGLVLAPRTGDSVAIVSSSTGVRVLSARDAVPRKNWVGTLGGDWYVWTIGHRTINPDFRSPNTPAEVPATSTLWDRNGSTVGGLS